ncbi:hypothetical protein Ciccas_000318 [Cichlidogyrus casuarinus]|uniref:RFX1-4/6/8-like BCD domain-containing protein n=1 Tax=Cichlidogyrus casuarinus TaxID=1844966 RepID=A0ABD2QQK8_9PLAT
MDLDAITYFLDDLYLDYGKEIYNSQELNMSEEEFIPKAMAFARIYENYLSEVHSAVIHCQLDRIFFIWAKFWRQDIDFQKGDEEKLTTLQFAKPLPENMPSRQTMLMIFTEQKMIAKFIDIAEFHMYHSLLHIILRECTQVLPSALSQFLLRAIKNLKNNMEKVVMGLHPDFVKDRLDRLEMLIRGMRRLFESQQVYVGANSCLADSSKICQIFDDILKVDFQAIQNQCAWALGQQSDSIDWITIGFDKDYSDNQFDFKMDESELPSSVVQSDPFETDFITSPQR